MYFRPYIRSYTSPNKIFEYSCPLNQMCQKTAKQNGNVTKKSVATSEPLMAKQYNVYHPTMTFLKGRAQTILKTSKDIVRFY